jgi:integrase
MSDAAPTTENRTLRRLPNATYRQREYLTEAEVERLIEAARKRGRNGTRDGAAILLAYRHGLRAAELCQLRWSQIDLRQGRLVAAPVFTHCTVPSFGRCDPCKAAGLMCS